MVCCKLWMPPSPRADLTAAKKTDRNCLKCTSSEIQMHSQEVQMSWSSRLCDGATLSWLLRVNDTSPACLIVLTQVPVHTNSSFYVKYKTSQICKHLQTFLRLGVMPALHNGIVH